MGKGTSRRAVLTAAAAAAGTALTAGCSEYGDENGGSAEETEPAPSEPPVPSGESPGGGTALAKTTEIPVGGGKIFKGEKVVVTQPEEGSFKAFSAVCTHQGCTVSTVEGGTINCACHGSKFRVADASVEGGPAQKPLPRRQIIVESGSIRLA
ncbi:Rieske (2Fe-2S) protein [Streptomyces sp. ISL-100]|uniref:Rieske (2Fe-2S) protein n=1 Tax=Streptomyces sp. ISL-100 TaxID=2819173 RepID=UPI001BEC3BB3|nr:Rieske (2Fe-2S) protein [Streptomyces sp. ISL-100]MBT2399610.1 Rieske (2Fe-2S) protein [Streptomyces sp. ISL-100]